MHNIHFHQKEAQKRLNTEELEDSTAEREWTTSKVFIFLVFRKEKPQKFSYFLCLRKDNLRCFQKIENGQHDKF